MKSDPVAVSSDLFAQGYNCSQSVFTAFAKENGLDPSMALKIATSYGGGIGRTGNVCGAVSGAILAIGLTHGMDSLQETEKKEKCYALDQEFIEKFTAKFGSINCTKLLGYNLGIPAEREEAGKKGVIKQICPGLVKGAAEILEELLKKNNDYRKT
ncbi:MAG: C_GCAxxG_C_C family protein [Methanomicrobiales archaeon]|nr:C_GCAxxG_C_C family protein [Methanomicrobiales archaeon]